LEFETFLQGKNLARPISTHPLSNMAVQHLIKLIGERAGLRNVGPHMLRRSFATHLYDHGAALEVVQALLGHRFLQTTLGYTRLSTGRLKKTFERCHPRRKMNECAPGHGEDASPQIKNVD
jgi:site-specific recombinase XerD